MNIKIIANPQKKWAAGLAREVRNRLKKDGHAVVRKKADATVCIGGDGTILYANHNGLLEGGVLGIGTKTSHICQITRENWRTKLPELLKRNRKRKITGLVAKEHRKTLEALNDFVLHSNNYRVIRITVEINRKKNVFEGDGLIVSSGVGSSAYAYSAGGKILSPYSKKIEIVPICPYKRDFSAVVLPKNTEIVFSSDKKAALIIDGIFVRHLVENEKVRVKSGRSVLFYEGVGRKKR